MTVTGRDVTASAVDPSLPAAVAAIRAIADRTGIEPLPGGLTNHNYKVTSPRGSCVLRLAGDASELLRIDRETEYLNSVAASESGAGPDVIDYLPGQGILLINWLPGRTLRREDLRDRGVLARVAAACRRLHGGPRFANDFDMFQVQRGYLELVQERGFRLPRRYLDFQPLVEQIRTALQVQAGPTVPCHNDLLAENLIDDGRRVWLIDFEYSGNNDPCFELGNIWSEAALPPELLGELLEQYFGLATRPLLARARLFGLMSKYGWTLWASIQDAVSNLDFDFWTWGMEKYERAVEEFDGPELARLLDDVRQPS